MKQDSLLLLLAHVLLSAPDPPPFWFSSLLDITDFKTSRHWTYITCRSGLNWADFFFFFFVRLYFLLKLLHLSLKHPMHIIIWIICDYVKNRWKCILLSCVLKCTAIGDHHVKKKYSRSKSHLKKWSHMSDTYNVNQLWKSHMKNKTTYPTYETVNIISVEIK